MRGKPAIAVGLAALFVLLLPGSAEPRDLDGPGMAAEARRRTVCLSHLKQIGLLLAVKQAQGDLEPLVGSAYLLQTAADVSDEGLDVFLCPGDPRRKEFILEPEPRVKRFRDDPLRAPCSYRGPDRELLALLRREPQKERIIACDGNGEDGRTPLHRDGVTVLYNTFRVAFLEWKQIEGSDGKPVAVGPESPDARFRHLVLREGEAAAAKPDGEHLLPRIWEEVTKLRDRRAELEERVRKLEAELQTVVSRLRGMAERAGERQEPGHSEIEAHVIAVSMQYRVVMLDVGSKDGVKPGMEFSCVWEGGRGTLVVDVVSEEYCTCFLSLEEPPDLRASPPDWLKTARIRTIRK